MPDRPGDSPRDSSGEPAASGARQTLPAGVYFIGVVSLLNDIATDMVTPLIPLILASVGAGGVALGLVEGLANAVSSLLRLWAGRRSDRDGGRRKPLALSGYALSIVARPMLAFATSGLHVALVRAVDRIGKGIRTAPRDALIVDLSPPSLRGRAFGVQVAFDNFGAVCGALLGFALVTLLSVQLVSIVWISLIPGVLSILVLGFLVQEPARHTPPSAIQPKLNWSAISAPMKPFLLAVMLFTFARVAELFVILRAHELGASTAHALLLWAAFNATRAASSYVAGILADRHGRMALMVPGWALHATAMFVFCAVDSIAALWVATLFFGFAMSLSEGVERSVIGDHALPEERGTLFGWYHALVGLASIPAGLALGGLWQAHGPWAAYLLAGSCGMAAAIVLKLRVAPAIVHRQFPRA